MNHQPIKPMKTPNPDHPIRNTLKHLALASTMGAALYFGASPANAAPPVTTDLKLHLDASQITGLTDDDTVHTWTDMSGLGDDVHKDRRYPTTRPTESMDNQSSILPMETVGQHLITRYHVTIFGQPYGGAKASARWQWHLADGIRAAGISLSRGDVEYGCGKVGLGHRSAPARQDWRQRPMAPLGLGGGGMDRFGTKRNAAPTGLLRDRQLWHTIAVRWRHLGSLYLRWILVARRVARGRRVSDGKVWPDHELSDRPDRDADQPGQQ